MSADLLPIAIGAATALAIVIVCAIVFAAVVFLLLPKRCDACGLPIKRGRCGYPDCDFYRKGHP